MLIDFQKSAYKFWGILKGEEKLTAISIKKKIGRAMQKHFFFAPNVLKRIKTQKRNKMGRYLL